MTTSRKDIKAQRARRKQQERRRIFIIVIVLVLVFTLILTLPTVVNALRPVGEINTITSSERPLVDGRSIGNPDAKVVVEVFEDFQCPMCAVYSEQTEAPMLDAYIASGQVYYIFRHYPFEDDTVAGNESDQAANASMCAAEQNRFWDYKSMIFANQNGANQGALSDKRLVAFAETLGLDMDSFNDCFRENRYQADIDADTQMALEYGVRGTPSVFVNGEALTPGFVPSYEELKAAIDAALGVAQE
jgi:protein-disulfide isomerase